MTEQQFEAILHQSLHPEIDPEDTAVSYKPPGKGHTMKAKSIIRKVVIAAAVVMMLAVTASAAELLNIKSMVSTNGFYYDTDDYKDMDKVMKKAGFEITAKETFENGYTFQKAQVKETAGLDEHGEERFTYRDISLEFTNADGKRLHLNAHQEDPNIPDDDRTPNETKMVGEIQLAYQLDTYRLVPEDYELTAEDEAWMAEEGHYLSYGSDEVRETNVAFLRWQKEGVVYFFMDMSGTETTESLYAMAEELIAQ